jgi:type III secretory pathway component EscU
MAHTQGIIFAKKSLATEEHGKTRIIHQNPSRHCICIIYSVPGTTPLCISCCSGTPAQQEGVIIASAAKQSFEFNINKPGIASSLRSPATAYCFRMPYAVLPSLKK